MLKLFEFSDAGMIEPSDAEICAWPEATRAYVHTLEVMVAELERDAQRYRYLRDRDLDTIHMGGVFVGRVPENVVVNGDELDAVIDWATAN